MCGAGDHGPRFWASWKASVPGDVARVVRPRNLAGVVLPRMTGYVVLPRNLAGVGLPHKGVVLPHKVARVALKRPTAGSWDSYAARRLTYWPHTWTRGISGGAFAAVAKCLETHYLGCWGCGRRSPLAL